MTIWVETFKGAVLASEYDAEAYMNSQIYVARFDQATWFLLHAIGVTPASIKRQKLRVAIVRQNYQFLAELRGGELVAVKSGFVAVGAKYVRFLHQMFDCVTNRLIATSDCTAVLARLATGKSIPLPPTFRRRAQTHLVQVADRPGRRARRRAKARR
ncbi:MAG TPA: thioesterase family protein [Stellaceae bacterium]|nr:thioesterase family protein [Stellaceae bacterium]